MNFLIYSISTSRLIIITINLQADTSWWIIKRGAYRLEIKGLRCCKDNNAFNFRGFFSLLRNLIWLISASWNYEFIQVFKIWFQPSWTMGAYMIFLIKPLSVSLLKISKAICFEHVLKYWDIMYFLDYFENIVHETIRIEYSRWIIQKKILKSNAL